MFKKLFLFVVFLFLAGCKINASGWLLIGDRGVAPPLVVAPLLFEVAPIGLSLDNNAPEYTFSSSEDGTISFTGDCTSTMTNAIAGNNTIIFEALDWDKEYSNCNITVTNADNVTSNPLSISTFQVVKRVTLNDTGVIYCGNYSYAVGSVPHDNTLDCWNYFGLSADSEGEDDAGAPIPAGQDMYFGRDDSAGNVGFSFQIISGGVADCVQDNVTDLLWERKTTTADKYNQSITRNWQDTLDYVAELNTENFCGYNDWRIPSREELQSISHRGARAPALDTDFFVSTTNISNDYWTSSENKQNGTEMYSINFHDGQVKLTPKTSTLRVRLVRGIY